MKKIIILLAILTPLSLLAQNQETRSLKSFNEVSVSQSIKLILVKGDQNMAEVSTDGDLSDVITEVSGGALSVKRQSGNSWNGNNRDKVEVRVTYTEELNELRASSSGRMTVETILVGNDLEVKASSSGKVIFKAKTEEISLEASSSGDIEAEVNAEEAKIKASSSGSVKIKGNSISLKAAASSSGSIRGEDFSCSKANLASSSSGSISVAVEDELNASASSSGRVIYSGSPKIKDMSSSSGGKVKSAD